jgi:hypothetical protein
VAAASVACGAAVVRSPWRMAAGLLLRPTSECVPLLMVPAPSSRPSSRAQFWRPIVTLCAPCCCCCDAAAAAAAALMAPAAVIVAATCGG